VLPRIEDGIFTEFFPILLKNIFVIVFREVEELSNKKAKYFNL